MKSFFSFILLILLACCLQSAAQKKLLQFEHLGTGDGLSQNNVLCILQDSHGFMWFGTRDGLNKYDGYKFTVYKNEPLNPKSISSNFIKDIIETSDGDLWLAILGGGLSHFDRQKNQFTNFTHNDSSNSISNNFATSVTEDIQGNIWIGTEMGLNKYDRRSNKFKHFFPIAGDDHSLSDNYIRKIFQDSNHDLWIGTFDGGLNLYNKRSMNFTRFIHHENEKNSISCNNIYTLFEDSKKNLWVGTDGAGMDLFDRAGHSFRHFKTEENNANGIAGNSVFAINEDEENNLLIGTENGGLGTFDVGSGTFHTYRKDAINNESIGGNSIYSIYKDTKKNIWLGTFNAGVDLVNRDKNKFAHIKQMLVKNSLSSNYVLCIYEDAKKNIWIGTDGGGLNLFNPLTGNFTHYRHQKNNKNSICGDYVLSVCQDKVGNIWIGTWGAGITVYNPASNSFRHFKNDPNDPLSLSSNNAWKIFEDHDKNIWIGTYNGGVDLLNADKKTFTHYMHQPNNEHSIGNNKVFSIFEDSENKLWVGTDAGGLNLFNKDSKTFTRYLHKEGVNSIANNSVSNLCEDHNKNLWIGTSSGLSMLDKATNRFTTYTEADGLPHNVIMGILEDDRGHLWISTLKGISEFDPTKKLFTNYNMSDGVQGNEFKIQAFCKSSSGMMYFGGNNGLNQFFPDEIKSLAFEPPLVITNFQVFNKEVNVAKDEKDPSPLKKSLTETKSISLPYSDAVFSLEFASLNYTSAEKKKYAYMLVGFDKNWNDAGTARVATYTNLDPGAYTFKVKGLNNEGKWSANMISLEIIIMPPFWLTWWFKLLVAMAILSAIVGFYKYRVYAIQTQKRKLQRKVHKQTLQLLLSSKEEQEAREEAEKSRHETELLYDQLKLKNKELEQFAYVASHDLQEPLRTTSSFVALIQKQYMGQIDEKADKYLTFIADASNRMKVLIKDLLDFSRIGTKGQAEILDSNAILNNVLKDLSVATQEARANIQYENLPAIHGYPTEIKLLFQNLLINAIKFRKQNTIPNINIDAHRQNGHWKFGFKDNGIGIAKENQDRIFDIFQRLHSRTEYDGSGIGLSHCKKIVELHHGKIWVESTPGQGSVFYFTIPEKSLS